MRPPPRSRSHVQAPAPPTSLGWCVASAAQSRKVERKPWAVRSPVATRRSAAVSVRSGTGRPCLGPSRLRGLGRSRPNERCVRPVLHKPQADPQPGWGSWRSRAAPRGVEMAEIRRFSRVSITSRSFTRAEPKDIVSPGDTMFCAIIPGCFAGCFAGGKPPGPPVQHLG